jgi:hypothetical protein
MRWCYRSVDGNYSIFLKFKHKNELNVRSSDQLTVAMIYWILLIIYFIHFGNDSTNQTIIHVFLTFYLMVRREKNKYRGLKSFVENQMRFTSSKQTLDKSSLTLPWCVFLRFRWHWLQPLLFRCYLIVLQHWNLGRFNTREFIIIWFISTICYSILKWQLITVEYGMFLSDFIMLSAHLAICSSVYLQFQCNFRQPQTISQLSGWQNPTKIQKFIEIISRDRRFSHFCAPEQSHWLKEK